jgi:hypothetical protein
MHSLVMLESPPLVGFNEGDLNFLRPKAWMGDIEVVGSCKP